MANTPPTASTEKNALTVECCDDETRVPFFEP
jgi:hypothetical protein